MMILFLNKLTNLMCNFSEILTHLKKKYHHKQNTLQKYLIQKVPEMVGMYYRDII